MKRSQLKQIIREAAKQVMAESTRTENKSKLTVLRRIIRECVSEALFEVTIKDDVTNFIKTIEKADNKTLFSNIINPVLSNVSASTMDEKSAYLNDILRILNGLPAKNPFITQTLQKAGAININNGQIFITPKAAGLRDIFVKFMNYVKEKTVA